MLKMFERSITHSVVILALAGFVLGYSIPAPKFEPIQPKGFRVWIPDESGIALFAFHGALDHKIFGGQAGDFFDDTLTPTNGRWVYENTKLSLEPGQKLYYWIHVQHGNHGYRLDEQRFTIPSSWGTGSTRPEPSINSSSEPTDVVPRQCEESKTTVRERKVCQGELIFEENFDIINWTRWRREIRIPLDVDDADFVVYDSRPENCYITNGMLYIQPQSVDQLPGYDENKIRNGAIDLGSQCTGIVEIERECKRQAKLFRILPPIVSARLSTKDSFSFRYGKIEVRAKLPKGDWLFPLIVLESKNNDYGISGYASGQMRVAYIRGNEVLWKRDGMAIDGSYLSGGVVLKTGERERDSWLKSVHGTEHWGNDFHTYSLIWTDTSISLGYDGNTYATINGGFNRHPGSRMAPFDKEFFISLAVSAGGISDFPDGSVSGTYNKPWENNHPKAELKFYMARNKWNSTWKPESSSMVVDYVKVWAL